MYLSCKCKDTGLGLLPGQSAQLLDSLLSWSVLPRVHNDSIRVDIAVLVEVFLDLIVLIQFSVDNKRVFHDLASQRAESLSSLFIGHLVAN